MRDLTIRSLRQGEADLFLSYPFQRQSRLWETGRDYVALLATREYRPKHTWVAIRDGVVVARACWWTGPQDERPAALDWLEAEPGPRQIDLGTRLLLAAHEKMRNEDDAHPDYHLFLPPGWRDLPEVREAAEARMQAARNAGLELFVERFSYAWSAQRDGLPPRSVRLQFKKADDDALLAALRQILDGTLDAHSQRDVVHYGLARAAELQLKGFYWFPSPRDWWQLAYTLSGELVGVIVPARNFTMATIGYLGVVPDQRGRGYANDLLAEMAWQLSELAPGEEVGADTDIANVPMARAFERAGFRTTEEHLVMTDSSGVAR